jgi:hypothetical protein
LGESFRNQDMLLTTVQFREAKAPHRDTKPAQLRLQDFYWYVHIMNTLSLLSYYPCWDIWYPEEAVLNFHGHTIPIAVKRRGSELLRDEHLDACCLPRVLRFPARPYRRGDYRQEGTRTKAGSRRTASRRQAPPQNARRALSPATVITSFNATSSKPDSLFDL